jgi:hypothetical protein
MTFSHAFHFEIINPYYHCVCVLRLRTAVKIDITQCHATSKWSEELALRGDQPRK